MVKVAMNLKAKSSVHSKPTKTAAVQQHKEAKLPGTYLRFIEKFPRLGELHEEVAKAVDRLGPLDSKTCELIKIGICTGARQESALKSHVRRAMRHGASVAEIEQAILLAMTTCGFPAMVAAWHWAQDQIAREASFGPSD